MSGHQALRGEGAEAQGLEDGRQGSTVTVTVPGGRVPNSQAQAPPSGCSRS